MNTVRAGQPGATRVCPHCKATVLESAAVCPGCRHHLRFNNGGKQFAEPYSAFSIDSTIAPKAAGEPCEYCVVLDITNERGEQVMRQVVGVGALQAGELRRLNVSVEVLPVLAQSPSRAAAAAGQAASPSAPRDPNVRTPMPTRAPGTMPPPAPARPTAPVPTAAAKPPPPTTAARPAARPAVPAARPGGLPPGPSPSVPTSAAPAAPSAALAQRLRIFRKP